MGLREESNMKSEWVWSGIILIIVAIILTVFTLGLGIICTGPMFLIGVILFIIGLIIPENEKIVVKQEEPSKSRFCTSCGRSVSFDAKICPYCGKNFETQIKKRIYCSKCGIENSPDANFCIACGNELTK